MADSSTFEYILIINFRIINSIGNLIKICNELKYLKKKIYEILKTGVLVPYNSIYLMEDQI